MSTSNNPASPSVTAGTADPHAAATSPEAADPAAIEEDLPEQLRIRREKRERLIAAGIDPYPVGVERTTSLSDLRLAHTDLPADTATGDIVGVTGRVIFIRNSGKLCFATIREGGAGDTGTEPADHGCRWPASEPRCWQPGRPMWIWVIIFSCTAR